MTEEKKPKKQPKVSRQQVEDLQQQVGALTEALQRERADAENLRRRHAVEIAGLRVSVKANVVQELLPIIDNFERSLKHVPTELIDNDYVKGVEAIVKQFGKTLSDMGVELIPGEGAPFDPNVHEAVSVEEMGAETETVSEVLQSGYKLGDTVIRPATVRVKA